MCKEHTLDGYDHSSVFCYRLMFAVWTIKLEFAIQQFCDLTTNTPKLVQHRLIPGLLQAIYPLHWGRSLMNLPLGGLNIDILEFDRRRKTQNCRELQNLASSSGYPDDPTAYTNQPPHQSRAQDLLILGSI